MKAQRLFREVEMVETKYAYIGIKSCGCVVATTVEMPGLEKETAKDVADFIRSGLSVERIPVSDARNRLQECIHKKLNTLF